MGQEQKAGNGKFQTVPGITPALHLPGRKLEEDTPLDFDLSYCKCPCISCSPNLEALILEKKHKSSSVELYGYKQTTWKGKLYIIFLNINIEVVAIRSHL